MEENEVNVLTRDKAVSQNILPTGRKVGVTPVRGTAFVSIGYVDGKPGKVPDEYQGMYTGIAQAQKDINKFVNELWNVSDNATKQAKKPLSNNAVSR